MTLESRLREIREKYKEPDYGNKTLCRGCFTLGTACMKCERCRYYSGLSRARTDVPNLVRALEFAIMGLSAEWPGTYGESVDAHNKERLKQIEQILSGASE